MNFKIRLILFALALITMIYNCKCEEEVDKFRLIERIEKLKEESFPGSDEQPDKQCVKNFLNFPKNDKMIVNEMESLVLMIAPTLKCLGKSKLLNFYFDMLLPDDKESKLNCMRYNLKKIEPESKLLENFEISDEDAKKCEKDFPLDELEEVFNKIEHITGPAMEFSCGSFAGYVDVVKLLGRIAGIKLGNFNEEFKETEIEKLKKHFEDVVLTTAECILKRFEKDPEAFHINDTLNYYYTESLKPSTLNIDADHTTNYYDNLNNLETNFDQECIKEKLNLPENGQKVLLKIEALTIIVSAKSKCIKDDKSKFYDDYLKFAVDDDQKTDEKIACAKYELQKIEPTSKLVQLPNNDKDYEKICNSTYIGIFPYNDYFYNMYRFTGKLEETTCGIYNHQDRDELYFKTLLLAVEKDEALKKSEAEDFFIFVTSKLQKLSECFLGRI